MHHYMDPILGTDQINNGKTTNSEKLLFLDLLAALKQKRKDAMELDDTE